MKVGVLNPQLHFVSKYALFINSAEAEIYVI
jgi:hypothetical protein